MTTTLTETRAAWDDIAAGYDKYVTPFGDWALPVDALRRVGLRARMRLLDVASGSGALSIPAARLGADVVAVDLSPNMIARLRERARREGLTNIEARVMDGHALTLDDDSFDIAGSQFGVNLFPDLPRALCEMARVTRPGGKVLMVVDGPPSNIDFLDIFMGAMHAIVPGFTGLPMDPPPLPFQVSDPEVLRRRLTETGLRDVRVEIGAERLEFHTGKELWDWVVNSHPIARMLIADLTEQQEAEVQQELDRVLRERSDGRGSAVLTNQVNIGIGTK
jgi:ubiquinone/menaquinone biosynthesis C-methylase UbiE